MVAIKRSQDEPGFWEAIKDLGFLQDIFNWISKFLAIIAEPMLYASTLYTVAEQGVPAWHNAGLNNLSVGCMLMGPEALLPGGFVLVKQAQRAGREYKVLAGLCWLFMGLMFVTLASVFIFHLDGLPFNVLMWARCAVAVCYSVYMRMQSQDDGTQALMIPAPDVLSSLQEFSDLVKAFSDNTHRQVAELSARVHSTETAMAAFTRSVTERLEVFTEQIPTELAATFTEHLTEHLEGYLQPTLNMFTEQAEALNELASSLPNRLGKLEQTTQSHLRVVVQEVQASLARVQVTELSPTEVRHSVNAEVTIPALPERSVNIQSADGQSEKVFSDHAATEQGSEKRAFILHCLAEHPGSIRNSEIARLAAESGLKISPAYISMVRSSIEGG